MIRFAFIALVALALSAGSAFAQAKIEHGPIKNVNATDAKGMFASYCAVCHGTDGKELEMDEDAAPTEASLRDYAQRCAASPNTTASRSRKK